MKYQIMSQKTSERIKTLSDSVASLLISKNKAYGNSALEPANIFSGANAVDSLCARLDDKLMRIKNKGLSDTTEDTLLDIIGYLLLLKLALEDEEHK